jgi:ABC-2 type transport system permease protein
MNTRALRAIVRKDLKVISQSKAVTIPLIIVPVLLFVVMPAVIALLMPVMMNMPGSSIASIDQFMAIMPSGLLNELAGYKGEQRMLVYILVYMFAPLFLIVPMMTASVIAADSFAGEKERKTLEALLYTPTTDRQLLTGKLLAAWIPAILTALVGFVLYTIVVNAASWPVIGRIFFPNLMWVVLVFWVAPAMAGLALLTMVLVSKRVKTFQEAYQMGSAVVVPVLLLVYAQVGGLMYFNVGLVLLIGLAFWAIDAALLWYGVKTFQRGELIAQI